MLLDPCCASHPRVLTIPHLAQLAGPVLDIRVSLPRPCATTEGSCAATSSQLHQLLWRVPRCVALTPRRISPSDRHGGQTTTRRTTSRQKRAPTSGASASALIFTRSRTRSQLDREPPAMSHVRTGRVRRARIRRRVLVSPLFLIVHSFPHGLTLTSHLAQPPPRGGRRRALRLQHLHAQPRASGRILPGTCVPTHPRPLVPVCLPPPSSPSSF